MGWLLGTSKSKSDVIPQNHLWVYEVMPNDWRKGKQWLFILEDQGIPYIPAEWHKIRLVQYLDSPKISYHSKMS